MTAHTGHLASLRLHKRGQSSVLIAQCLHNDSLCLFVFPLCVSVLAGVCSCFQVTVVTQTLYKNF